MSIYSRTGQLFPTPGPLFLGFLAVLAPTGLCLGAGFPLLCALRVSDPGRSASGVGAVYAADAVGGAAAGAVVSLVLLSRLSAGWLVAGVVGLAGCAAATLARRGRRPAMLALLLMAAALPAPLDNLLDRAREVGWLGPGGGAVRARLETPYHSLLLSESAGQYALWADGRLAGLPADASSAEHEVHPLMLQRPGAESVLLLGGLPLAEVTEVARHPARQIVHVARDPGLTALAARADPDAWARLRADPRIEWVDGDAPRYVRRGRERFDLILVWPPDPDTLAGNRYHTVEFFGALARRLNPGGVVCTVLTASERLGDEAAGVAAGVYRAMSRVFPAVAPTAGARLRLLAGSPAGPGPEGPTGFTLDRATLEARARPVEGARHYRPEYLRAADDWDGERADAVRLRLESCPGGANSDLRPVTVARATALWLRQSGSPLAAVFARLDSPPAAAPLAGVLVAAGAALAVLLRRRRAALAACALAGTGATTVILILALLAVFQAGYGHVYTRVGAVMAAFLIGSAAGAAGVRRFSATRLRPVLFCCEFVIVAVAAATPLLGVAAVRAAGPAADLWITGATYALASLLGAAAGTEFARLASRLTPAGAALADNLGGAAGAILAGVALIPILGVAGVARALVALRLGAWLALVLKAPPRPA